MAHCAPPGDEYGKSRLRVGAVRNRVRAVGEQERHLGSGESPAEVREKRLR